jgi:hypothetical protein
MQTFGIKVTPVDIDKLTVQQQFAMKRDRDNLVRDFLRTQRRFEQGLATEEELTEASENFNKRIEAVSEKYARRMTGESPEPQEKARGGPVRYSPREEALLRKYAR